ncbi:MAG: hypothetical protein ACRC2M_25955 [Planktothrix sp.]
MDYSINFSSKAIKFIVEALEFRLQKYQEQLSELTDEDEISDIGNDCYFLEAIAEDLKKHQIANRSQHLELYKLSKQQRFIDQELASAPTHSLENKVRFPIPNYNISKDKVAKIQLENQIPGIEKKLIPLGCMESFEVWLPKIDRAILLDEDIKLLENDCARIEKICDRLFSLLDCICSDSYQWRENVDELEKITSWEIAQEKLLKCEFKYQAIAIDYERTQISPRSNNFLESNSYVESWDAIPEKWIVTLYNFEQSEFGFGYKLNSPPFCFEMQISRKLHPEVNRSEAEKDKISPPCSSASLT